MEPPAPHRALHQMSRAADLIGLTTPTLHYRDEVWQALVRGARALGSHHIFWTGCVLIQSFTGGTRGAAALDAAWLIHISSPDGTDLVMDKAGRRPLANCGAADTPGHLVFWGLGAVQAAQLDGTTQGRLVLDVGDCVFHRGHQVEQPVTLDFTAGRITLITGGLDAALIRAQLGAAGERAF